MFSKAYILGVVFLFFQLETKGQYLINGSFEDNEVLPYCVEHQLDTNSLQWFIYDVYGLGGLSLGPNSWFGYIGIFFSIFLSFCWLYVCIIINQKI